MKLARQDVLDLMRGIQSCGNVQGNAKFTYALSKNGRVAKKIVVEIQDTTKLILKDYHKDMEEMAKKFTRKDEKTGNPIMNPNGTPSLDPIFKMDFEKGKEEINEKYKEPLAKQEAFMDEEIDVDIHLVDHTNFPDMAAAIADLLFPMRKEG